MTTTARTEWSATHVRLRLELFILGLVIFSLFYFDLTMGQNAWLGFTFGSKPAFWWSAIFLYSLFVYVFACLVTRTFSESLLSSPFSEELKISIEKMSGLQATLQAVDEAHIDTEPVQHLLRMSQEHLTREMDQTRQNISGTGMLMESEPTYKQWSAQQRRQFKQIFATSDEHFARYSIEITEAVGRHVSLLNSTARAAEEARKGQMLVVKADIEELLGRTRRLNRTVGAWRILLDFERLGLSVMLPIVGAVALAVAPLLRLLVPDISFS